MKFIILKLPVALLAVGLLTGLTNCKRPDGDTLCEGTVVDRHDNTRLANATVGVYVQGTTGGGLGGGYRLKEEHQADDLGKFAFQISDDAEGMLLRASTPLGHYTAFQEGINLRGGKNNKKLVLRVYSPAWVRVNVISQAPRDTAGISFFGSLPTTGALLRGGDTTLVIPVEGNATTTVHWEINRLHQNLTTGSQAVYCPGLDTTSIQVTY